MADARLAMEALRKLPKVRGVGDDEIAVMIRAGRQ